MRKWRCTVCGYIHLGKEPPEICPVCGAGREAFVDDGPAEAEKLAPEIWTRVDQVLRQVTYGLFILGTRGGERLNGAVINTFMQVAEDPLRAVFGLNKSTLSWEFLRKSGVAAIALLPDGAEGYALSRWFGLRSGRDADKFATVPHHLAANGCPIPDSSASFLEIALLPGAELDAGSHTVFLMEITNGGPLNAVPPLTYDRYREIRAEKRVSPAPNPPS